MGYPVPVLGSRTLNQDTNWPVDFPPAVFLCRCDYSLMQCRVVVGLLQERGIMINAELSDITILAIDDEPFILSLLKNC